MDRGEFDTLVLQHLTAMHRLAVRLTASAADAEEIVQDATLKALRSASTFQGRSTFSTWMTRIVINAFRDHLHRRTCSDALNRRVAAELRSESDPTASPPHQIESRDLQDHVARCVSILPPRQREALVLTVYQRLTMADTAQAMETTEQNVRTTLHHAREKLKEMLSRSLSNEAR